MRIYLLGIAGTGMGSFAGLLRKAGHEVAGSDENVYPPMSDKLRDWGIRYFTPYAAANLEKGPIDLAVVGNVIRAENPEAKALRRRGVPHMSFPEALEELVLTTRHPAVIAGTHGKTTTTSLRAQVLQHTGRDPSLLVGGVPLNFNEGFRLGGGEHFVIEGDEYDTAYFDKGPKFLHYRPPTPIFTGAEFDHADIYRDTAHYESAFEKFFALLPQDGYVAACSGFANSKRLASFAKCKVESYCVRDDAEADWHSHWINLGPAGASFEIEYRGVPETPVTLPPACRHNVENALRVYAACRALGLKPDEIKAGCATFRGAKRRQELRGELEGVAGVRPFAHPPPALPGTHATGQRA